MAEVVKAAIMEEIAVQAEAVEDLEVEEEKVRKVSLSVFVSFSFSKDC